MAQKLLIKIQLLIRLSIAITLILAIWFSLSFSKIYAIKKIYVPQGGSLFVDINSNQIYENGSSSYPFKSIQPAIKVAKQDGSIKNIFISPGIYRENAEVPKNVNILGNDNGYVILDNSDLKTGYGILLEGGNLIYGMHIIDSRFGIKIPPDVGASILKCKIEKADRYGIYSEESQAVDESRKIIISNSNIFQNKLQGLYLQKGYIELRKNTIEENGEEGVDLHLGMTAVLENNTIRKNGEGGIESEVWDNDIIIRDNVIENNANSGINTQSGSQVGKITILNNKIQNNGHWGIRCVVHKQVLFPYFRKLIEQKENAIDGNQRGNFSEECSW